MPTRTGYTDSNYVLSITSYGQADSSDSDYFLVPALNDSAFLNDTVFGFTTMGDSNYYFDRQNTGASATYINQVDSATNLISTLRVQLANAESSGGGAIQTWSS